MRRILALCLALASAARAADLDPSFKIFSGVLGSDRYDRIRHSGPPMLRLVLNNDKTKVGAEYSVCSGELGFDDCDTIRYVFPQLAVDQAKREISFQGAVIAVYDLRDHVKLAPGYVLVPEIQESRDDDSFDTRAVKHVVLYIGRKKKLPVQS